MPERLQPFRIGFVAPTFEGAEIPMVVVFEWAEYTAHEDGSREITELGPVLETSVVSSAGITEVDYFDEKLAKQYFPQPNGDADEPPQEA